MDFEVVIGLEVHAQITSNSKLFSRAKVEFGADPNTLITFLDVGLPGTLPVINQVCVDQAIKTGLGLHAEIAEECVFDRKNYFYPDLPLGYQISQFKDPIVRNGYLDIVFGDSKHKRIRINRLHIEQDAGKLIHDLSPDSSYVDLNRAGTALMEIVSEPDISSADEAMCYIKKLRSILRYLGTCDGNMEQGNLRVDVNISLNRPGEPFGTRAEIKNVNSIRFIGQAIEYEIKRQSEILSSGGEVLQETRMFDPVKCETRALRSKEDAHDYRYFPDPDLYPLKITKERIESIKNDMPELPDVKEKRFIRDFSFSEYEASVLTSERDTGFYFEEVLGLIKSNDVKKSAKMLCNFLIGEVFAFMNKENISSVFNLPFSKENFAELIEIIMDSIISSKIAKDIFVHLCESNKSPRQLVKDLGLEQLSDVESIKKIVDKVVFENASQVESYKQGKSQVLGFLIGLIMKETKGKANPAMVNEILKESLK